MEHSSGPTAMDIVFGEFAQAFSRNDGYLLARTLSPVPPPDDPARLYNFYLSTNAHGVATELRYKLQYNPDLRLDKKESLAWQEVFASYWKFLGILLAAEEAQNVGNVHEANWAGVYEVWKEVVNVLYRQYQANLFGAWTIPCLYNAGKFLRIFAIKADEKAAASQRASGMSFGGGGLPEEDMLGSDSKNEKLEDATRQINRIFGLCISDRNPLHESRKWALYYIANLLFKTYFKLNQISLSKNILRSLRASTSDMPPLSAFPKAHQTTFKYYCGVIHFIDEDYATAEEYLTSAYDMCLTMHSDTGASKHQMLILTYLIPTRLLTSHKLPSKALLAPYPRLAALFSPLASAILAGDLAAFTAAMEQGEDEFVKRRIYLTLERGRDIILRNIFRKVFVAGGFEAPKEGGENGTPQGGTPSGAAAAVRRTRVPVREFAAALMMAGAEVGDGEGGWDGDEVECLIANAIYKNLMKGYIARERGIVVLSKAGAFPGTGV